MMGADYLIRHGQDYAHLDLRNSYGQYIQAYYGTSYPSGADTLFGGSAFLLGLPLIWAFQPFNAFMLASAGGPAWLLARRIGLVGAWAALAALTRDRAGARIRLRADRLGQGGRRAGDDPRARRARRAARALADAGPTAARRCPFALVARGRDVGARRGFGAWGLAAACGPRRVVAVRGVTAGLQARRGCSGCIATAALVVLVAALPTWAQPGGLAARRQNIASTGNPATCATPLRPMQVFGDVAGGELQAAAGRQRPGAA